MDALRALCSSALLAAVALACAACGDDDSSDGSSGAGGAACDPALAQTDVDVGEVTLAVTSQGCGPTLLMLHGFPEFDFSWDPLVPGLEGDYRLVRPNQRGYGPSEIPADVAAYEADHLIGDVVGLIDATTSDKVVLVAHDWGGVVAWMVAQQHPDRLRGLVVLNAPPPGVWAEAVQVEPQKSASGYIDLFLMETAEATLEANDFAILRGGLDGLITEEQSMQYQAAWAQPGTLTGGLSWYRANLVAGPMPAETFPGDVPVTIPVLLLWGDQDQFLLGDVLLPGIAEVAPDAEVKHFPDAGHFLMYEEPEGIVDAIRTFVDAL
jgi:pimeloyl-ACP methyl ester carboxylesterase